MREGWLIEGSPAWRDYFTDNRDQLLGMQRKGRGRVRDMTTGAGEKWSKNNRGIKVWKGWAGRNGGRVIWRSWNGTGRRMRGNEKEQRSSGSTMSQLSSQVRFLTVPEQELIKYVITSVSERQPQIDSCTSPSPPHTHRLSALYYVICEKAWE